MKIKTIMAVLLIASVCVFANNIDASSAGVIEKTSKAGASEPDTLSENADSEDESSAGLLDLLKPDNDDENNESTNSGEGTQKNAVSKSEKSVNTNSNSRITTKSDSYTTSKSNSKQSAAKDSQTKSESKNESRSEAKHEHSWEPVYETITVEDYGNELHEYCKGCGADITSWSNSSWIAHSNKHLENGEQSGFYEKEVKVVTATHQIQKRVGWRCSCGATK